MIAIVAGALGIAAGKTSNKGLLIAYMVLAIITAIYFALAIGTFGALTLTCSAVNDLVDAACTNDAGESYCCFACTEAMCEGQGGCLWVPEYTDGSCVSDDNSPLPSDPCDKDCCDAAVGTRWEVTVQTAGCRVGLDGQAIGAGHGTGTCQTASDVTNSDQCDVDLFGTYSNSYITSGGASTFANTGCHAETEGGGADTGLCDYTTLIWITILVTLGTAIAGSVMGCCVVCCGNDGSDDSDSG